MILKMWHKLPNSTKQTLQKVGHWAVLSLAILVCVLMYRYRFTYNLSALHSLPVPVLEMAIMKITAAIMVYITSILVLHSTIYNALAVISWYVGAGYKPSDNKANILSVSASTLALAGGTYVLVKYCLLEIHIESHMPYDMCEMLICALPMAVEAVLRRFIGTIRRILSLRKWCKGL